MDYARYFLIEAKGDPDPREVKQPSAIRDSRFMIALGQIISRMDTVAGYYYGIAVPTSYEPLVYNRVPWQVCKRLRLRFLLVDGQGGVEEITWRKIRGGRPQGAESATKTRPLKHKRTESGWDIMKRQMPNSEAVEKRLQRALKAGRGENYLRSLKSLKHYWEKKGQVTVRSSLSSLHSSVQGSRT